MNLIKKYLRLVKDRKITILFGIMIAIYLIPIWRFPYFPTQDGPSHIHNSHVLKDFRDPEYKFAAHYRLNIKPFPNWINYIIMAGFQFIFPPIVSEKLFLTIYVVMMAISFYYLLDIFGHERRIFVFISFPFIYNFLFLMGFYNFAIAIPFMFFSTGYFWKHKDRTNWKSGIILGLLLVLTYFSHPVPYLLAMFIIFALSIIYFRKKIRGIIYNAICLIPSAGLFINYAIYTGMTKTKRPPSSFWNMPRLLADFVAGKSLVSYNAAEQTKIGYVIFGFIALMIIATIISKWRFRDKKLIINLEEKDYLIFGFIISFGLYIYAPDGIENQGGFITLRLSLISSLFLIPLISENIGRIMRAIALVLMIFIAVGNFIYLYDYIDVLSFELEEYTAGVDRIGKNIVMLPLIFDKGGNSQLVQIFTHAPNYYCLDNGNINLGNYEAAIHYFPINFRDDFDRPTVSQVHYTPNEINFAKVSAYVDYIVAFGYDKNILDKVGKYYELAFSQDRLSIYKKK